MSPTAISWTSISPGNFDRGKDIETVAYVKQQQQDWAWTALVQPELQNFEYTTEWLPRGDFYTLGTPAA